MSTAETLLSEYLGMLRRQFYTDDKAFFQQRRLLIKALTLPARWFEKRGVFADDRDYRKILDEVIQGIKRHGDTGAIKYFSGYFLLCLQTHMKHHEEAYYDRAKSSRRKMDAALNQIRASLTPQESPARLTEDLAALSGLLRSPGGKRRAKNKPAAQPDLFAQVPCSPATQPLQSPLLVVKSPSNR